MSISEDTTRVRSRPEPALLSVECDPRAVRAVEALTMMLRQLAGRAAAGAAYEGYTPKFVKSEVTAAWLNLSDETAPKLTLADLSVLSHKVLESFGFILWEKSTGLRLIPLWALNMISDGEELTSISGRKVIVGEDDIDLDTRGGCVAWGFVKDAQRETKFGAAE